MAKKEKKKDPVIDADDKGDRIDQLGAIVIGSKKKYGYRVLVGADELDILVVPRIPTGLYGLDLRTNGGYPIGRITMEYGEKSSAKTSTYLRALANAQRLCANCYKPGKFKEGKMDLLDLRTGKRKKVHTHVIVDCPCGNPKDFLALWVDAEKVWLSDWSERMGVWPEKVILMRPDYGEQAYDFAVSMVNRGAIDMIVIDSLAALAPAAEVETSMEQAHQGVAARMNNKFLRKLVAGMNKCFNKFNKSPTLWLVNQYREKIGVLFGSPDVVTGGKGQGFATTLEIEFRPGVIDKDADGEPLSALFRYSVKKNKVGVPGGRGDFKMCLAETDILGVGDLMEHEAVLEHAVKTGFVEKPSQQMYEYNGESFRGKAAIARYFLENAEEYEDLKTRMLRFKLGISDDDDDE